MSGDVETGQGGVTTPLQKTSLNLRTVKLSRESGGKDVFSILCGTVCCYLPCALATLAIVNAFSIFLIVIGAMYKDDCPAKPHIGPLLIAMGALAIVVSVLDSCVRAKSSQGEGETPPPPTGIVRLFGHINSLIKLVKFGIFIYLCVLVYSLYSHVEYNSSAPDEDYCHRTLFLTAFWTLTITFIFLGLAMVFFCCCGCCLLCAKAGSDK